MLFYCEAKTSNGAVLDIHNLKELEIWWKEHEIGNWIPKDHRSLIEINNLKSKRYRGIREGYWYDIPDSFWDNFSFDTDKYSFEKEDYSLVFRLSTTYKGDEELDFVNYRHESIGE